MEYQSPFVTRIPGGTEFQSWRPLPFVLCVLLLLPVPAMSQASMSEEDLRQEWLEVQQSKDRHAKKCWWRREHFKQTRVDALALGGSLQFGPRDHRSAVGRGLRTK